MSDVRGRTEDAVVGAVMKLTDARPDDDRADDLLLQHVFQRQVLLSAMAAQMANVLYRARCLFVGSAMTWDELTPLQRQGYLTEIETLIKEVK